MYQSTHTGAQVDEAVDKALNPDATPTDSSTNLVTSGGVAAYGPPPLYLYEGKDLTTAFASEISGYANVWAWLKARLTAKNLSGIFVKDYITVTTTDSKTLVMQIAGINHDLNFTDNQITAWHIDFISKDCWVAYHVWNKVNYNNGLSTQKSPWCASDLKAFLNAESANVPNGTGADPATTAVDYSSTGIYALLPTALKNVIIERRALPPQRYTAGSLLTDDNSWGWDNIGKLWVPDETEVYGQIAWGTRSGYSVGTLHQYEIFRDAKTRIKGLGNGGSRCYWWLRSAISGNSSHVTYVASTGNADYNNASNAGVAFPVCFRISA